MIYLRGVADPIYLFKHIVFQKKFDQEQQTCDFSILISYIDHLILSFLELFLSVNAGARCLVVTATDSRLEGLVFDSHCL